MAFPKPVSINSFEKRSKNRFQKLFSHRVSRKIFQNEDLNYCFQIVVSENDSKSDFQGFLGELSFPRSSGKNQPRPVLVLLLSSWIFFGMGYASSSFT